jgi:hypothetical protein
MKKLASSFIGPVATMEQRQRPFDFLAIGTIAIVKPAKKARKPRRAPQNVSEAQPF